MTPGNTVSLHSTKHCNDAVLHSTVNPLAEDKSYVELTVQSDLEPGIYLFRAKTRNFYGWSRCSLTGTYYTVLTPSPITSMTVTDPDSSPYRDLTPTIQVSGGVLAGDTIHLYQEDCTNSLGSGVVADEETSVEITVADGILTDPGAYTFYARITDRPGAPASTEFACSTSVKVEYELTRPETPSIALAGSLQAIDTDTTPTITVSSVVEGDQVHLYKDADCLTSIGSAVVPASATTVDITTRPLSYGAHSFKAKITQREDALPSECSTALEYTARRP